MYPQRHRDRLGPGLNCYSCPATKLGTRTYTVTSVSKVSEMDTGGTAASCDNRLTLYTCVRDQSAYRWMVCAVER